MTKLHKLGASENSTPQRRTLCGMWGMKHDEGMFRTDKGGNFYASDDWHGVSCKRCSRNRLLKMAH